MDVAKSLPRQLDVFFYTGDELRFEDLMKYKQHGFHPTILGDILPKPRTCVGDLSKKPRYRIMLKLGFGAFSTVWLARDLLDLRYVAVKIGVGLDAPRSSPETEILAFLRDTGKDLHAPRMVIQLLDGFIISGPNGIHECLVTEVIAPLSDPDVRSLCSSEAQRQIVEGFAFLHQQGIVHGDPHIANFGLALPQLEKFSEDEITEYFANPEIIPVIPRDTEFPLQSVPPYLTSCVSITEFLQTMEAFPAGSQISVRILDFGRSYRAVEKTFHLEGAAPLSIRPPEVVVHEMSQGAFGSAWSQAADVWAVGCTLYHVRSGNELISTWGSLKDYLLRAVQFGGPPPETWLEFCGPSDHHDENGPLSVNRVKAWELREASRRPTGSPSDEDRELFLDLIKGMILTKPVERLQMADLLTHPFLRDSSACST